MSEVEYLRAENKRLRAALKEIVDIGSDWDRDFAQNQLSLSLAERDFVGYSAGDLLYSQSIPPTGYE